MIRNNNELYSVIEDLIAGLARNGEGEWSQRLHDAMYISTVAGEVLGTIKLELSRLALTDIPQRLGFEDRVKEAIVYIDAVLSPRFR